MEDDDELRREILDYLVRRAQSVTAVRTSAEAQEILAGRIPAIPLPDVVLCDLNLEDGSGVDLFVEFAPLRHSCPWILMSGDPDPERLAAVRQRVPGLPPCTIVSKPVSMRMLTALISGDTRA
ncbi:response regulator [uncultured Reyranella sp.]|uniref:response regulator n=1 Tax=uncultured Reyranella sp. TaxID=735512 RepID=UPI0025CB9A37|nr:response regulator [uncultured Reyranella sp.]